MGQPLRILLVEDSEADADLIRWHLDRGGIHYDFRRVETELDFGVALEGFFPDIVLADYRLPAFSGLAALEMVRKRDPDMPFILVSGTIGEEMAVESLKRGATDYILKDNLARLAPAVQRAVAAHEERQALRGAEAALHEARQQFDAFMNFSPVPSLIRDAGGRLVFANRSALDLFFRPGMDWQGKTGFELFPEAVARIIRDADREALAHGRLTVLEETLPTTMGNRDFLTYRFPIADAAGRKFLGVVGIDLTERKRGEERVRYLAHHDGLTGLPNRILLLDRLSQSLAQAQRSLRQVAVLFLDLDNFKAINDFMGHHVGDELLRLTAHRIKSCLREEDTVARQGGDEFIILLGNLESKEGAAQVAGKILDALRTPFLLNGGRECHIGGSVGVSVYPDDGSEAEDLLQNADTAMYYAKTGGKNRTRFFAPEMALEVRERISLERDLRLALEREELELHYQPRVRLADGKATCIEALIRWRRNRQEWIAPEQFLPMVEEIGLILPLGERMLRQVCRQWRAWADEGLEISLVSLKLSPFQFQEPGLPEQVTAICRQVGMPIGSLELEISEAGVIRYGEEGTVTLERLKAVGVKLGLDDFGADLSSLARLKRLPVDRVKIHRSLVEGIPEDEADAVIVAAVAAMARGLGWEVVAEGVERQAQVDFLRRQACEEGQGGFFCSPLPPTEVARWLRKQVRRP